MDVGGGEVPQFHVVEGVDADLVAAVGHLADQVLVALDLFPDEKKGGLHPTLLQALQQLGGGGAAGAVVEGEGQQLGLWLGHLHRAVRLDDLGRLLRTEQKYGGANDRHTKPEPIPMPRRHGATSLPLKSRGSLPPGQGKTLEV